MAIALQNPGFCNQLDFIPKNKTAQGSMRTSLLAALHIFQGGMCGSAS